MAPRKRVVTWGMLIDRFITQFENEATESTSRSYRWVLNATADALGPQNDPLAVTEDDLLDVLGSPKWKDLSKSSRKGRISVWRTFFKWVSRRYDVADPTVHINAPRRDKRARRRLTRGQVEALMLAAHSERDKLIIWTLAMTAIRRQELVDLRWRDVDRTVLRVVLGKGRKGREIPMPAELAEFLNDVRARLQERGEYSPEFYVCPRTRGITVPGSGEMVTVWHDRPMAATQPSKIVVKCATRAGIPSPTYVGCHDLRHAYATRFLEDNPNDVFRLQSIMGHADIGTTRQYLAAAEAPRVAEAVNRLQFLPPAPNPKGVEQEFGS